VLLYDDDTIRGWRAVRAGEIEGITSFDVGGSKLSECAAGGRRKA
jgi:hypothetical protein